MLPMTSFLKLPAEIRNQVYSLVAADEGPCQVNPILVHIGIESGPNLPKPINLTRNDERLQHGTATGTSNNGLDALLHTTRTIREECLSFLLHQNVITTHSSIGDLIDALGKPARHLRRLILLQQRCHSMSVPPKSSSTNLLHACSTIQAQLPKLERLDIAVENNAAGEQEVFVWASHHRLPTRLEPSSVERQCNAAEHIAVSLHKRTFDKLTHGKSMLLWRALYLCGVFRDSLGIVSRQRTPLLLSSTPVEYLMTCYFTALSTGIDESNTYVNLNGDFL